MSNKEQLTNCMPALIYLLFFGFFIYLFFFFVSILLTMPFLYPNKHVGMSKQKPYRVRSWTQVA